LKFTLRGKKLKGSWVLVRTRGRQWLLIKHKDSFASAEPLTETKATSALSDRTLAQIAADEGGNVAKAATGDTQSGNTQVLTGELRRPAKGRRKPRVRA